MRPRSVPTASRPSNADTLYRRTKQRFSPRGPSTCRWHPGQRESGMNPLLLVQLNTRSSPEQQELKPDQNPSSGAPMSTPRRCVRDDPAIPQVVESTEGRSLMPITSAGRSRVDCAARSLDADRKVLDLQLNQSRVVLFLETSLARKTLRYSALQRMRRGVVGALSAAGTQ